MRRILQPIAVVLAVVLSVSACGTTSGSNSSSTLKVGTTGKLDTINPFVSNAPFTLISAKQTYPTLVDVGRDGAYQPLFATKWVRNDGGTRWTFSLVEDAKWSDGQPITAEDAEWTISTVLKYQKGPTGLFGTFVTGMTGVSSPDKNTLVLTYKDNLAPSIVLNRFSRMPILPKHVWSSKVGADGTGLATYNPADTQPIVSGGPFQLNDFKKGESAVYTRNSEWWGKKPKISGWGIKTYPNLEAQLAGLKEGEIDSVVQIPNNAAAESLKSDKALTVSSSASTQFLYMGFNVNKKRPDNPELRKAKVRQAISMSLDRHELVEVSQGGRPGSTVVPPGIDIDGQKFHNSDIPVTSGEVDRANALLDELGYKRGSNGIRVANGHPMSYEVLTATSLGLDRTFESVARSTKKIGIKLTQKNLDDSALDAAESVGDKGYAEFDINMRNWTFSNEPDNPLKVFTCDSAGSLDETYYCNPEYDRLFAAQRSSADPVKRKKIVDKMQSILAEDLPYVILYYPDWNEAHSAKWNGFVSSPAGSLNWFSIQTLLSVSK